MSWSLLAICFGAMAGALFRYKLSLSFDKEGLFPKGTFAANMIATAILALSYVSFIFTNNAEFSESPLYLTLIFIEVLSGALSTYATFSYQCVEMFFNRQFKLLAKYSLYTIMFSFAIFDSILMLANIVKMYI